MKRLLDARTRASRGRLAGVEQAPCRRFAGAEIGGKPGVKRLR